MEVVLVVGMGGLRSQTNQLRSSSDARAKGSWQIRAAPQGRAFSEHSWFHTDPKGEGRVTHRLYMRMRMLRVGGWDGTAGKRSRCCQRVHVRHGQEYATGAGVAWQGQGMPATWRGGSMGCGLVTFLLGGEAAQAAGATHPRRANPRHAPDVHLQG